MTNDAALTNRNIRTVWTIPTQPYPGAHYATFPEALPKRCILASTPSRCCAACGAPEKRAVEVSYENPGNRTTNGPRSIERKHVQHGTAGFERRLERKVATTGHAPTCSCDAGWAVPVVLDPFCGSGTVVRVARSLGREGIGLDLSMDYLKDQAAERIRVTRGLPW